MRLLIALGLATVLATAPAAQAGDPLSARPAQQQIPRSWIPERKPEPPLTATPIAPPKDPAITHAPGGLSCSSRERPEKTTEAFARNYSAAQQALVGKRWAEALTSAEATATHATTAEQFLAVENTRLAAARGLGDKVLELETLDAIKSLGCPPVFSVFTPPSRP